VIVAADFEVERASRLNDLARDLRAKFVSACTRGVFGSVFCDFGDDFTVLDRDGEQPRSAPIKKVKQTEVRPRREGGVVAHADRHFYLFCM
jgi:ubiquitin-activating enzyme E1